MKKYASLVLVSLVGLSGCGSGGGGGTPMSCGPASHAIPQDHGAYLQGGQGISAPLTKLHGHVPSAVPHSTDLGKLSDSQALPISVALQPNNEGDLQREISDLYRPGSSSFHKFLSPDEFRAKYAPTADQIAQVTAYLRGKGFTGITADANGFLIHAIANVSSVSSAFQTEVHQFISSDGTAYRAPAYELQIPSSLPIQAVHGLQNLAHAHPQIHAATGPAGGYSPSDINTAYNVPAALNGSGQTLALFELDGYTRSDITTYEARFGLPAVPLENILVNGANGSAGSGAPEVTLDIDLMIALAPGASKILVYEGTNDDQGILATYSKIASDDRAKAVSTSWGNAETLNTSSFLQSENTIFMQMAAQGQSIYAAAGDNGAYDNGRSLSVDDPGSQPYVVSVGGTSLRTNASGSYASETTWDSGSSSGAGGGGKSVIWTMPSWQNGVITSANKGSTTMRNVPDVALNADTATGYSIYYNGSWGVWGGTSCAAPLWAAFTALANQARAQNNLGSVGFPSPTLYQIGQGNHYRQDFFDIADGSTNLFYPAVTGYDDATGWGSFNATALLQDLGNEPTITSGATGGQFSPSSCAGS